MIVRFELASLNRTKWYEYLVRFVLGGAATVLAGMIADADGPSLGGLFLAFPAIFFASTTLIEKNERERKAEK